MLFALSRPLIFIALVLGYLCSIVLRAAAFSVAGRRLGITSHRGPLLDLRRDVDPFGAVGAAVCGIGWGKMISVDEVPRWHGRGRAALFFLSGPLACIIAGEVLLAVHAVVYGGFSSGGGFVPAGEDVMWAFSVELLMFGLLALIPIPPLDGFGVLYFALRRPGNGMHWMRQWFEEKNLGVVVLLAFCLIPFGGPYLLTLMSWIASPFLAPWAL